MARKSKKAESHRGRHASGGAMLSDDPRFVSDSYENAEVKPKKKKHIVLRVFLIVILLAIIAAVVACIVVGQRWLSDLPECDSADDLEVSAPTQVYASDGTTLLASFYLQYRDSLDSLDEVGYNAKWATVAIEDERFYDHGGFDPIGIARAFVNNLSGGDLEGASTITQQLARNTVLSGEMTEISVKRKLREIAVAVELENNFSKDDILLMYMNTVNYGSGAYGIEAAAQRYFSKSASELTLGEAALLAGIPQSPTYNNPIDYPDTAKERRNDVLDRMAANGFITQAEATLAKAEKVELHTSSFSDDGIYEYPYFTSYVRDQLLSTYGLTESQVYEGGLTVYTTLDPTIQEYAEESVAEKREQAGEQFECAMTAIDPSTGYIKAMVGGSDYYTNQYNLAAQAKRSPGSSFKTFTLVAAIEQGISPKTYVNCSSYVKIADWEVKNFQSTNYGTRTIEQALAVSSNTGFARLIAAVGVDKVIDVAQRMGITSDLDPVLGLTLGQSTVTTLEMADAYATLANGGTHYDAVCVTKVVNRSGKVIVDNTDPWGERAITREVAYAATKSLETVITSGTATAARLSNGQVAAGKTGTSEYEYDHWFCGYTPQMSVAIWLGDPNNQQALPVDATSAFSSFMNKVLEGQDPVDFPTANDPEYTKKFSNTNLDVNVSTWDYSWYSYSNTSNNENTNTNASNRGADYASNSSGSSSERSGAENSSGEGASNSGGGGASGSGDSGGGGSSGDSGSGGSGSGGGASGGGSAVSN